MGRALYAHLKRLISPATPDSKSFDEFVAVLENHYRPATSIIAERFHFYKRNQHENEELNEPVLEIKNLPMTYDFGNFFR
jgi:hypothetical protein